MTVVFDTGVWDAKKKPHRYVVEYFEGPDGGWEPYAEPVRFKWQAIRIALKAPGVTRYRVVDRGRN